MLIIGEKINSTRQHIETAVRNRDRDAITAEAKRQAEAGAQYLDINCGTLAAEEEPAAIEWLTRVVQEATGLPLCIDSPNARALAAALAVHQGEPIVNSISGESQRYDNVISLVKQYNTDVIALCLDDSGIPADKDTAVAVGDRLVRRLLESGIPAGKIYLDPLVRSVATNPATVLDTLEVMRVLGSAHQSLHFISGLSNVSFGLPERRHLNRAYAVMAVAAGLDAVIMDPLDKTLRALILAAEALANRDRFCLQYIDAYNRNILSD